MIGVINATHYTRGMQFLKKKWKKLMLISVKVGEHGEAKHIATVKDFIIKGVQGEFYFCKPDIFFQTYEIVYT